MKVIELLEDWESSDLAQELSPSFRRVINKQRRQPNHKYIGSGSMAYVGMQDRPDMLDRVSRSAPSDDGGSVYHRYITLHPNLHNNPYLPRVLSTPNASGSYTTYQIERLKPLSTFLENELIMQSLWKLWFNDPFPSMFDLAYNITSRIERAVGGEAAGIRDPLLLQAVNIVSTIAAKGGHQVDISDTNLMWRITGKMPQLVITDPLV